MARGVRPPFPLNIRLDRSSPLVAGLTHAWITAPLVGAETGYPARSKVMMRDLVKGHNVVDAMTASDQYCPPVKLGTMGYGVYFDSYSNDYLFRTPANTVKYYGNPSTPAITVVAWVHLTSSWIDYCTIYTRYHDPAPNGLSLTLYHATGREYSFGLSYGSTSSPYYHEAHAGDNALLNYTNKDVLLGWSGKFGTAASHVLYINGKSSVPWWFNGDGTASLNDTEPGSPRGETIGNDPWTEEFGVDGKSAIYTVMYWDRILSPAEHMMLYEPQARFSFIDVDVPPKFWSVPWYYEPVFTNSLHIYLAGTSGGTSTSDTQPIYLKGSSTATDNQPIYLNGRSSVSDNQAIYLKGQSTTTDSQPIYLKGLASIDDTQSIYIKGYSTQSDTQPIYIKGTATLTDSQTVYLRGQALYSDNQPIYIAGSIEVSDTQPIYINASSNQADDTQPIYLKGYSTASDTQPIYILGQSMALDTQPIYLSGISTITDTQPVYLVGSINVTDNQAVYLKGSSIATDNQSIYLAGLTFFPFTYNFTGDDFSTWDSGKWLTEVD